MSNTEELYAVCTKCRGLEKASHLSRLCPQCGYMRMVRKKGETEEQGHERDAAPLTDEERGELLDRCSGRGRAG